MADEKITIQPELDLKTLQKQINQANTQLKSMEKTLSKTSSQKTGLEQTLDNVNAEIESTKHRIKELKEDVKFADNISHDSYQQNPMSSDRTYEGQVYSIGQIDSIMQEANAAKASIAEMETKIPKLMAQSDELANKLIGVEGAEKQQTEELNKQKAVVGELEAQAAKLSSEEHSRKEALIKQTEEIKKQKAEQQALKASEKEQAASQKASEQAHAMMSKTMRKMGGAIFGIASIWALLRKAISYTKEAIVEYAATDTALQGEMNSLQASLQGLKMAWGAAFSPILSAIIPILKVLIGWLTTAANTIGAFFSALSGKGTYKAISAGMNSVAKSAGGAGKAAEEAKRELAGFDEITKLSDQEEKGGGGGGGSSNVKTETVAVPKWIKEAADWVTDLAQKIKKNLEPAFKRLKSALDRIKRAFERLHKALEEAGVYDKLKDTLETIGTTLGDLILNSLTLIADVLTLIADVITALLTGDWSQVEEDIKQIGIDLQTIFTDLYKDLHLDELVEKFKKWAKESVEGIVEWFKDLPKKISEKIGKLSEKLGEWVGGTAKWIQDELPQIIDDIVQWFKDLPSKISEAAGKLVDTLSTWLSDAADWVTNPENWQNLLNMGKDIWDGICQGITDAITGVTEWVKTYVLTPFIDGFKKAFGIASPAKEMIEPSKEIGNGILEGIAQPFKDISNWVNEHIVQPIKDAITKKWEEVKLKIVAAYETVGEWSTQTWNTIKEGAETIKKKIQATLEKVGSWASDVWGQITAGAATLKKTITASLTKASDWSSDAWSAISSSATRAISVGVQLVKSGWSSLQGFIGTFTKTIGVKVEWYNVSGLQATVANFLFGKKQFPRLKFAARGGILDKATALIAGEEGAEAIVPLEKHTEWINKVSESIMDRMQKSQIGDLLSGRIPAIAMGGVTPYATGNTEMSSNSDVITALNNMTSILQQAIVSQKNYILSINSEQLTKAVVHDVNKTIKMTGESPFAL